VSFQGLRDYQVTVPAKLRSDLQRQNALLESALGTLETTTQRVPAAESVFRDAQAQDDQFVLADATRGAITVTLPPAGKHVLVAKTDGSANAVNVAPSNENQTINGAAGIDAIVARGLREYFGDGAGNWWRR
jgi:hypothetical protein